jgi:hypothetical protein
MLELAGFDVVGGVFCAGVVPAEGRSVVFVAEEIMCSYEGGLEV